MRLSILALAGNARLVRMRFPRQTGRVAITYDLVPHPSTPTKALKGITVTVQREAGGRIGFDYTLVGNRAVTLYQRGWDPPARKDELWQTTCFEAFLMPGDGPQYVEFNFASTQDWAAYSFTDYREGREDLHTAAPIFWHYNGRGDVQALIDLHHTGMFAMGEPIRLGLSAVIEDRRGKLSYWALAHGGDKPDFHDPACFTAQLPAPPGA